MITINDEKTRKKSVTLDKPGMLFCLEGMTDPGKMSCRYQADGDEGVSTVFNDVKSVRMKPFTLNPDKNVLFALSGLNMSIRGNTSCTIDNLDKLMCDRKQGHVNAPTR